jgi:two-component system NtrC family sensor kinase
MTSARLSSGVVSGDLAVASTDRPAPERARRATSLQTRLVRDFSIAILIPALVTTIVGARMIQQRVVDQAQADVNSDLESAKVIYQHHLERLEDALRIHAKRSVIYGPLAERRLTGLDAELQRILDGESLDVLTITDATGSAFHRASNPGAAGIGLPWTALVARVLRERQPQSSTEIIPATELAREAPGLEARSAMTVTMTPRARPAGEPRVTSGMMLVSAAPVLTPEGRCLGVLYGGVLLNRNYETVDKVVETVFKDRAYEGQPVGTATIFQDDVRISTNVRDGGGARAIATRASAEVADAVLGRGETWRGRAFVVNDWYLAAYAPIRDSNRRTIGMLYVGSLERPYTHLLWRTLATFLGIAVLGVVLVNWVAVRVARRISGPIQDMAHAARAVAQGDYSPKVHVSSGDEISYLAASFNTMTSKLAHAHQELLDWGEQLERKVEQRTAELKAAQQNLLRTAKLAAVGRLAAGVAHEINNPLTGVLTNSSLMLEDLADEDPRREELQTIVNETLRCRKIVKGLLDFARQTQPHMQALSINQVVEDILALVRNQANFRNLTIQTALDAALPPVMADGDQMRQVILNIVLNAADAMPQGGTLRITSAQEATGGVTLQIADTGKGIPDEIRDRLFEPFFTTKSSGTGLGLAIAYGIVEQHKGTLTVESVPGRGTTIVITLPVSDGDHDVSGNRQP